MPRLQHKQKDETKIFFSSIFLFCFWLYINYQIYVGATTGKFDVPSKGTLLISYNASPIFFILCMGATILFSLLLLAFIVFSIYGAVDRKVKAYGGNYNINTFKAIFRNDSDK